MKVMSKKFAGLIVAWIVLVLVGLSLISYRQKQYFEEHLEKNISEMEEKMEDELINLGEKWEDLDKSDPSKICYYSGLETTSLSHYYHLHVYEYFRKKDRGNVLTGTFSTQADEGAFLESVLIVRVSHLENIGNGVRAANTVRFFWITLGSMKAAIKRLTGKNSRIQMNLENLLTNSSITWRTRKRLLFKTRIIRSKISKKQLL